MGKPRVVVIGSANMDLVYKVDRLPRAGETIKGGNVALYPGGKGANQACAAAQLGGNTLFIAQVGNDTFGAILLEALKAKGVNTGHVRISPYPTGCASIYVLPDGENSIVLSPGANEALDSEAVISSLDSLEPGDWVLSQLEISLPTVRAALAHAKAVGATTILDPAPTLPLPQCLFRHVDFLTPNQTEAMTLLGHPGSQLGEDAKEAEKVAVKLLALGPRSVILKLGRLGCYVAAPGVRAWVPGFEVTTVDTTAAGDIFNGALAVALTEGRPLLEAARFANAAAAISVTRCGAQSSIPSRSEVDELLAGRSFGEVFTAEDGRG